MIKLITTKKSWVDNVALEQIENISRFEGVQSVAALPDLHNGPVGMAMVSKGNIYPHLVGNDIGCGMALFQTSIKTHKVKLDQWEKSLSGMNSPCEYDLSEFCKDINVDLNSESFKWGSSLGTIGKGNHFAEFQKVDKIFEKEIFEAYNLDSKKLFFMVHSGSRGLGKSIMDDHVSNHGSVSLKIGTPSADEYLLKHNEALAWAEVNRQCIAYRFSKKLNFSFKTILDESHNGMWPIGENQYVHRKGANPSTNGLVMIAGSRGTLSYLVKPITDDEKLVKSNFSLAHGAGRKHNRSEMRDRLYNKNKIAKDLLRTDLGGRVLCDDKKLLFEEAPEAYKNISHVISDLLEHGLIEVVASFTPVLTYKVKGECSC